MPTTKLWNAGDTLTAADMMAFADLGKAWTAYTPVWTAATVNPVIGNGSLLGRYVQLGAFVSFVCEMTAGSTTTFGTGQYSLTLPVACRTGSPVQYFALDCRDDSLSQRYGGNAWTPTGLACSCQASNGSAFFGNVTSAVPFAFATLDSITMSGTYEAA